MLVKDVMNRRVITISPDVSIREAAKMMEEMRIGSLVVLKHEKLVGIITEHDILTVVAEGKNPETTMVGDVMHKEVTTISPTHTVNEAAETMAKKKIKKLPVMDGEKLVGIITATDIAVIEPKLIENLATLLSIRIPAYKGG